MARPSLPSQDHLTDRLLGQSSAMHALRQQMRHLAAFDTLGNPHVPTVLLLGETGTGKGLVARLLHDSGPRAAGPFLEVNCAALPATLLEAELFGFEAGAFTDARRAKPGLWEAVAGGTLLLDEVADLPLPLQSKLLTAIEAKRVRCLGVAASVLWCLGYPAQAVRRSQEALALALAHPYSLATAEFYAIGLYYCRREASAVQVHTDALLTLATAQRFPQWMAHGTFWQGWILVMQGQGLAGLAQMHQGLAAILATGQRVTRLRYLVLLAEAAGHAGQGAEGLHLLAEVWAMLGESKEGHWLTEAHRIHGELLLMQAVPDESQAEACFQQSLAVARRQQAKSWELRAALSLSRLWQRQGKRAEARELLAESYGWFTEGFDTADLQDARALLDALM